jgi:hypothetical protein
MSNQSNPSPPPPLSPPVPPPAIRIVFSDLDGTLIHYPAALLVGTAAAYGTATTSSTTTTNTTNTNTTHDDDAVPPETQMIIALPASSTGLTGTLTRETMALCRIIRRGSSRNDVVPAPPHQRGGGGCKLAFISGMRFSTLLTRIPYLPRADAYACDSGGRIFIAHDHDDHHPDDDNDIDDDGDNHDDSSAEKSSRNNNDDGQKKNKSSNRSRTTRTTRRRKRTLLRIVPVDPLDEAFYLTEDMAWRKRIEAVVGSDGYVGHELLSSSFMAAHHNNKNNQKEKEDRAAAAAASTTPTTTIGPPLPLVERRGPLWTCANALQRPPKNMRIDATGYATCFRINRQHNNNDGAIFDDLFASLHDDNDDDNANNNTGRLDGILDPALLTTSVNLGCIDVVPVLSGKKNWYVLQSIMCYLAIISQLDYHSRV